MLFLHGPGLRLQRSGVLISLVVLLLIIGLSARLASADATTSQAPSPAPHSPLDVPLPDKPLHTPRFHLDAARDADAQARAADSNMIHLHAVRLDANLILGSVLHPLPASNSTTDGNRNNTRSSGRGNSDTAIADAAAMGERIDATMHTTHPSRTSASASTSAPAPAAARTATAPPPTRTHHAVTLMAPDRQRPFVHHAVPVTLSDGRVARLRVPAFAHGTMGGGGSHAFVTMASDRNADASDLSAASHSAAPSLSSSASSESPVYASPDPSQSQQWLFHVASELTATEKTRLNDALAPARLGEYLPHNTYLVAAPAATIQRVLSNPLLHAGAGAAMTPLSLHPSASPLSSSASPSTTPARTLVYLVAEFHPSFKIAPSLLGFRDTFHRLQRTERTLGSDATAQPTTAAGASNTARGATQRVGGRPFAAMAATDAASVALSAANTTCDLEPRAAARGSPDLPHLSASSFSSHSAAGGSHPMELLVHLASSVAAPSLSSGVERKEEQANTRAQRRSAAFAAVQSLYRALAEADLELADAVQIQVANRKSDLLRVQVAPTPPTAAAAAGSGEEEQTEMRAWRVARVLAENPAIHWVERKKTFKSMNKYASYVVQSDVINDHLLWRKGILGRGAVVAVADTGVDHDNCYFVDPKVAVPINRFDPTHRKIVGYQTSAYVSPPDTTGGDQVDGHGTHTAGTVAGYPYSPAGGANEESLLMFKGLVYKSKLAIFDYQGPRAAPDDMVLPDDVYAEYLQKARNDFGAFITSNSWGDQSGFYDSFSRAVDMFTWDHPDFLNFFAAGNTGPLGPLNIASPALSKNVVAVGSSLNAPSSFFERNLDSGFAITHAPQGSGLPENVGVTPAAFGLRFNSMPQLTNVQVLRATPSNACQALTNVPGSLRGAAVLVTRGTCRFVTKAANVQAAGGVIMLVVNDSEDNSEIMYATENTSTGVVPSDYRRVASVMVARSVGLRLTSHAGLEPLPFPNPNGVYITGPIPFVLPSHHEYRLSTFSSRGPTKDGRIKPDILAPGEYIVSARSDGRLDSNQCSATDGSTLKAMQGTSMAAPVAAASAVMIREYLMKGFYPSGRETLPDGVLRLTRADRRVEPLAEARAPVPADTDAFVPSAALIKAMLVQSAVAVGGPVKSAVNPTGLEAVPPPPSIYQGHGRIKLDNVLTFADENLLQPSVFLVDYQRDSTERWEGGPSPNAMVDTGDSHLYCFNVSEVFHNVQKDRTVTALQRGENIYTTNSSAFTFPFAFGPIADPYIKVTLAYSDYPAPLATGTFLVNDLDLSAVLSSIPSTTTASASSSFATSAAFPSSPLGATGMVNKLYTGNFEATTAGTEDITNVYEGSNFGSYYESSFRPFHTTASQSPFAAPQQRTQFQTLQHQPLQAGAPPRSSAGTATATSTATAQTVGVIPQGKEPTAQGWDHLNNLESLTITSKEMLDLMAALPSSSPSPPATATEGVPKATKPKVDWVLSVLVHGTAVPHGPQPFALAVSTLRGGQIYSTRLDASVCGRALSAETSAVSRPASTMSQTPASNAASTATTLSAGDTAGAAAGTAATTGVSQSTLNALATPSTSPAVPADPAATSVTPAAATAVDGHAAQPMADVRMRLIGSSHSTHASSTSAAALSTPAPVPTTVSVTSPLDGALNPEPVLLCPNQCSGRGTCVSAVAPGRWNRTGSSSLWSPGLSSSIATIAGDALWTQGGGTMCICNGIAAGPDCSLDAKPLAVVASTVRIRTAEGVTATIAPDEYQYYYVHVPPVQQRTVRPAPGSAESQKQGLVFTFIRRSDAGDADYFVLAPPNRAAAVANSAHTVDGATVPAEDGVLVNPLSAKSFSKSAGGWPSSTFFSYANTMCDNCYDSVVDELMEQYLGRLAGDDRNRGNAASGGTPGARNANEPAIRVVQRILVPFSQIPDEGGVYTLAVLGVCCHSVTYTAMAAMAGTTLNARTALATSGLINPAPALYVAYQQTLQQRAQIAAAAGGTTNTSGSGSGSGGGGGGAVGRALNPVTQLTQPAIRTTVRLQLDMRQPPRNFETMFSNEMSALLGIDDGPCRVRVISTTRVPLNSAAADYPTAESILHDVYFPSSRTAATAASASPAAPAAPSATGSAAAAGPMRFAITFAILPPPNRAIMSQTRDALETCAGSSVLFTSPDSAEALFYLLHNAYELSQPSNTYALLSTLEGHLKTVESLRQLETAAANPADPAFSVSASDSAAGSPTSNLESVGLAGPRALATHTLSASAVAGERGDQEEAPAAQDAAGVGAGLPGATGGRSFRTLAQLSVMPFSSLVLSQLDVDHRPSLTYVDARLCSNGAYELSCVKPYVMPVPGTHSPSSSAPTNVSTSAASGTSPSAPTDAGTGTSSPGTGSGGVSPPSVVAAVPTTVPPSMSTTRSDILHDLKHGNWSSPSLRWAVAVAALLLGGVIVSVFVFSCCSCCGGASRDSDHDRSPRAHERPYPFATPTAAAAAASSSSASFGSLPSGGSGNFGLLAATPGGSGGSGSASGSGGGGGSVGVHPHRSGLSVQTNLGDESESPESMRALASQRGPDEATRVFVMNLNRAVGGGSLSASEEVSESRNSHLSRTSQLSLPALRDGADEEHKDAEAVTFPVAGGLGSGPAAGPRSALTVDAGCVVTTRGTGLTPRGAPSTPDKRRRMSNPSLRDGT